VRQEINGELLARVAQIYNEEGSRIGGKPVKAIQVQLGGSYRTAQDYVRKAREEGYLPTTTAGKVTTKQTRARKGKDDGKK
jgi:transposase